MLTISQFSKISQVPTKTLRYYDEVEILKPERVDEENNYRYYSIKQLETIFLIKRLRTYECTIYEIKQYLNNKINLHELLENKKKDINSQITKYSSLQSIIELEISALAEGGKFMLKNAEKNIQIVDSPELNVFSIRKEINTPNFSELMNEVYDKLNAKGFTQVGAPLTIYHSPEYTPEKYDTEVCIPVQEITKDTRIMKPNKCAMYHFVGVYSDMPMAYASLASWIDEKGFTIDGPAFEIYLTDPAITPEDQNEVDIYLIIK